MCSHDNSVRERIFKTHKLAYANLCFENPGERFGIYFEFLQFRPLGMNFGRWRGCCKTAGDLFLFR